MTTNTKAVYNAVMNEPTWVEENSLIAQMDMRGRCAHAAQKAADEEIAALQQRIAELEKQLAVERLRLQPSHEFICQMWDGTNNWPS